MPQLCPSAKLVASTLKESPEAAFLLDGDGIVLFQNRHAKRLLFETTDQQLDSNAADPRHAYHFSFFWSFASPTKPWRDFFDEIIAQPDDTLQQPSLSTSSSGSYHNSRSYQRKKQQQQQQQNNDNPNETHEEDSAYEEYDIVCKRTNGTQFPGSLRLTKVGACPCCEDSVYLCAYLKAKGYNSAAQQQNPFLTSSTGEGETMSSLHCILNASFDPVFSIDEHGTILLTNETAQRIFGYTNEEFLGNNIKMICGGGHAQHHDSYLRNYLDTGVKKIIGKKREVPARRKDGSEFPVELGVKEVTCSDYGMDHGKVVFIAFIKDLSVIKQHENEVQHKIDLMQGMIDASFDPMFEINQKGIIQTVNDAAVALFGYRREEMIGQNVKMICGGEHAANHDGYIKRYLETGQKHIIGRKRQVTARRKNGTEFEMELGVQEVVTSDGERLFCGFARDLTAQLLEKKRMRRQEQSMKGNFFAGEGGVAMTGSQKRAERKKSDSTSTI